MIPPGGSEVFYLVYHPDVAYTRQLHHGADEAEIRIQVDEAEYRFPVEGWCVGQCQFRAPTPAGPPSSGGSVQVVSGSYAPPAGALGVVDAEASLSISASP